MNLSMIKQALELKSKLEKTQKELAKMTVEAQSGNGAVKVTASGQQKILSIKISANVIDPVLRLFPKGFFAISVNAYTLR